MVNRFSGFLTVRGAYAELNLMFKFVKYLLYLQVGGSNFGDIISNVTLYCTKFFFIFFKKESTRVRRFMYYLTNERWCVIFYEEGNVD